MSAHIPLIKPNPFVIGSAMRCHVYPKLSDRCTASGSEPKVLPCMNSVGTLALGDAFPKAKKLTTAVDCTGPHVAPSSWDLQLKS